MTLDTSADVDTGTSEQSSDMTQFALHAQDGLARLGKLVTKHGTISTPGSLIYTRRGNSLFLTPDMLQRLKPQAEAVQITAIQFLENPNPETMAKSGRGAREFLALQGFPIIATNRDPTYYEYGTRPSNANAVYTMLPSGGMLVTPDRYMSTIKALQPDAYVAMCDEIYGDAKPKRTQQSVERTSKWLQQCVALHTEQQQTAMLFAPITGEAAAACQCIRCSGANNACMADAHQHESDMHALYGRKPAIQGQASCHLRCHQGVHVNLNSCAGNPQLHLACVRSSPACHYVLVSAPCDRHMPQDCTLCSPLCLLLPAGASHPQARAKSAAEAAKHAEVGGFALCGFGTGESRQQQEPVISAAVAELPASKPRLISNMVSRSCRAWRLCMP